MENFKKMKQNKENVSKENSNYSNENKPDTANSKTNENIPFDFKQPNSSGTLCESFSKAKNLQNINDNIAIDSNIFKSSFSNYENESNKKLASASLSYYFDFKQNDGKSLKLDFNEYFPYKNTEEIKFFNDKDDDKIIFEKTKSIDVKSENKEKSQDYFGPQRSKLRNTDRQENRRYKPY